ncbi:YSIRK-type signal peptide-containing protein [Macrococcus caseolyticus]|nr:YSIRK-type signal peptide-containing protein [Macrococcus caseolyticus]
MKKSRKSKLDFISNKLNKYSIRKFTVGTASILIGSLMFLGNSVEVNAAEGDTTSTTTTLNPATTEAPTTETVATTTPTTEAPTTEAPVTAPEKATNVTFNADNTELTGLATAGQTIELTLANGTVEKTVVNADGTFKFQNLSVASGEIVKVVAVDGELRSEVVEVTAQVIAPTTEVPTTEVPTTEVPTTEVPTTEVPTTEVPTTEEPTTAGPTTEAPTR